MKTEKSDIKLIQELLERNKKRIANNNPHWGRHHQMKSVLNQALEIARAWEDKLNHERSKLIQQSQKKNLDESFKTAII